MQDEVGRGELAKISQLVQAEVLSVSAKTNSYTTPNLRVLQIISKGYNLKAPKDAQTGGTEPIPLPPSYPR